ncbi:hypothetical protein M0805_005810 [Coniferiporia weirii]|nr:hypothetical protein M0805_005810 [Coniferiporia weirii]
MIGLKTLKFLSILAVASTVHGAPLVKRIAQVIADSTQKWEQACLAAGGSTNCNPLSVAAFTTLLIAAGPCDQQNAADNMIDLAHQLGSDPTMISFTQIFAQQPRNSPNSVSVPYCQQAPRNAELNGLFQCQFAGVNKQVFVGNVDVGAEGTIPFGLSAPVNPAGSCPANPGGPIADGTQLTDITSNPGVGSSSSDRKPGSTAPSSVAAPPTASTAPAAASGFPAAAAPPPAASPTSPASSSGSSSSSFALQNGLAAQKLNAQFAELSASSACTPGQDACISGSFAQCVAGADGTGAFVLTACNEAAGLTCAALPLVNSPGTSITCTTSSDAVSRIAETGATGGLTGSN